ncbi:hypothetical protein [Pseudomonas veronii]|uniref:hypothetical protein n=1 Tax=Pseudomonas veronii TaxID=76761 RepID=UPI00035F741B|nr:hypothetical protein [Pseudomonas veronii]
MSASTLNLKFIGTSADVDFAQKRDFQSGFEHLTRSKPFLHSLGQKQTLKGAAFDQYCLYFELQIGRRFASTGVAR